MQPRAPRSVASKSPAPAPSVPRPFHLRSTAPPPSLPSSAPGPSASYPYLAARAAFLRRRCRVPRGVTVRMTRSTLVETSTGRVRVTIPPPVSSEAQNLSPVAPSRDRFVPRRRCGTPPRRGPRTAAGKRQVSQARLRDSSGPSGVRGGGRPGVGGALLRVVEDGAAATLRAIGDAVVSIATSRVLSTVIAHSPRRMRVPARWSSAKSTRGRRGKERSSFGESVAEDGAGFRLEEGLGERARVFDDGARVRELARARISREPNSGVSAVGSTSASVFRTTWRG